MAMPPQQPRAQGVRELERQEPLLGRVTKLLTQDLEQNFCDHFKSVLLLRKTSQQ